MFQASLCPSSGDPTAFHCPVVAVVMLESQVARCAQTTIGSGTQLDLLMMGKKMPETC